MLFINLKNQNQLKHFQTQMKITVTDGNSIHTYDVQPNQQVQNIKALIQAETSVPSQRLGLFYQGQPLNDKDKLNDRGVRQGQLLYMTLLPVAQQNQRPQQKPKGGSIADMIKKFDKNKKQGGERFDFHQRPIQQFMSSAEQVYNQLKDDQYRLSQIASTQPQIASLVMNGNIKGLAEYMRKKNNQKLKKMFEQRKKFIQLSKDPMNPQYQKMLQQRIHQENIDKNLQFAQQYIPEVFGHITMLYINASINKVPIQAFVDSGAQSTIMSQSLAQRCNLMRLVDKRSAGTAVGVGTCKILGRIHAAEIEIQKKFITCSLTVIQNNGVQFLLGLDNLKRFNCLIDLKKNELNFNDGMIITKFLGQADIKRNKAAPTKEQLQEKVKKITSMGFSKDQALRALKTCNFNEQVASSMLMQNRFGG